MSTNALPPPPTTDIHSASCHPFKNEYGSNIGKSIRRNSSVELFRILATFLVVMVHLNGYVVDMPQKFAGFSTFAISQSLLESISIVCVNSFLIITGWYGLKFKWKHIWTIWSILVCIYVPFYLFRSIFINHNFNVPTLIFNFIAIGKENYYINNYLLLLFISPVLNIFIKNYGKKILPYTIAFWFIEIIFDWIMEIKFLGFGYGYNITHFILIYFLAQTAHLYKNNIYSLASVPKCIAIYLIGVILVTGMYFIMPLDKAYAYSNPIIVIMAFSLFFVFERKTFHNKVINWISSSTLAVYIIHCTPPVSTILRKWDLFALSNFSYSKYLLLMFVTIIIVMIFSILYDKIRCVFMPVLGNKLCSYLDKYTKNYINTFQ